MGGYGALKLAMRNPGLYSAVYAMAPALTVVSEIMHGKFGERMKEAASVEQPEGFTKIHWQSQSMIAFAAAVAPNPQSQPFLADLPIDSDGERRQHVWRRWLQHDLYTMIGSHRKNLLTYEAVAIDCGSDDELLPMNRIFVKALQDTGIQVKYEEFEGDHLNRITERMRGNVLPLFSKTLTHSKALQAVGAGFTDTIRLFNLSGFRPAKPCGECPSLFFSP